MLCVRLRFKSLPFPCAKATASRDCEPADCLRERVPFAASVSNSSRLSIVSIVASVVCILTWRFASGDRAAITTDGFDRGGHETDTDVGRVVEPLSG